MGVIIVESLGLQLASKHLLDNVSCQFQPGEISCLLGQNGAGKSTLLACVSKDLAPSAGHVLWQGTDLQQISYAQLATERAVLSQSTDLAFSLSVTAMVELGAEVQTTERQQMQAIVAAVLTVCDLQALANRDYLTLSGGEQKRTQLARVLAQIWSLNEDSPNRFQGKWLFLDEWTAGLDIKHQQRLSQYLRTWAQQGMGIVMVLHDITLASQLADKCFLLNGGELVVQGATSEVLQVDVIERVLEMAVDKIERPSQPTLFIPRYP